MHPLHGPGLEARTEELWEAGQSLCGAHRFAGGSKTGTVFCDLLAHACGSRPITETCKQTDDSRLLKKVKKQKPAVHSDGNVNWRHACTRLELGHHHVTHQLKMFTKSIRHGSVSLSPVAGTQALDRSWGGTQEVFCLLGLAPSANLKGHTALTVCEHSETLRPNDDVVRLGIPMLSLKN